MLISNLAEEYLNRNFIKTKSNFTIESNHYDFLISLNNY
jgi:hypothetical protein